MIRLNWLMLFVILLVICSQDVEGRRGRGRTRSKSRVNIYFLKCIHFNIYFHLVIVCLID